MSFNRILWQILILSKWPRVLNCVIEDHRNIQIKIKIRWLPKLACKTNYERIWRRSISLFFYPRPRIGILVEVYSETIRAFLKLDSKKKVSLIIKSRLRHAKLIWRKKRSLIVSTLYFRLIDRGAKLNNKFLIPAPYLMYHLIGPVFFRVDFSCRVRRMFGMFIYAKSDHVFNQSSPNLQFHITHVP